MFIVNEHGILNGWPDEWALPAGCRKASEHEIGVFKTTGQQDTKKMPMALGEQSPTKPVGTTWQQSGGNTPPTPPTPPVARPAQPVTAPKVKKDEPSTK